MKCSPEVKLAQNLAVVEGKVVFLVFVFFVVKFYCYTVVEGKVFLLLNFSVILVYIVVRCKIIQNSCDIELEPSQ